MTLAAFLDAAHALQVREATRLGVPLLEALDKTAHMGRSTTTPRPSPVETGNEKSMRALDQMMRGVKRA